MKKQVFIINALVLISSYKLFASTGYANDGLLFTLVIIGFLLILLGIFTLADYLKNNGKKLIYNSKILVNKLIISFKGFLNKLKCKYLKLSYFTH